MAAIPLQLGPATGREGGGAGDLSGAQVLADRMPLRQFTRHRRALVHALLHVLPGVKSGHWWRASNGMP